MSQSRFRFTIGQMSKVSVLCAAVFALLRTPVGVFLLVMIGPVVLGFILGMAKGGTGIKGGMLLGGLTFSGYGLAF